MPARSTPLDPSSADEVISRCPTGALEDRSGSLELHDDRCVHCFRCQRGDGPAAEWTTGFEWAGVVSSSSRKTPALSGPFGRSLHVRVVDAGACGACLREMSLLGGPHYNMHRLGFFVTPTPRQADVLLVAGPVTDHMREPLREAFSSMPDPKRVVAVGACAASGGVFGPSFACAGGAEEVVPVDVVVPGCPPPPLAVLHALLLVAGRSSPNEGRRESAERSE